MHRYMKPTNIEQVVGLVKCGKKTYENMLI